MSAGPHDVARRVRSTLTSVWPSGLGRSFRVPRGDDTRKRGRLGGRSVACDRSFDLWMLAVRCGLTIGDDRPVIDRRSVGVSLASLGVKSDGDARCDDWFSSESRVGGSLRSIRTIHVVLACSSRPARHRGFPSVSTMACHRRPAGSSVVSVPASAVSLTRAVRLESSDSKQTSAVGPRCPDLFGGRHHGCRRRRFGAPTHAVGRPPPREGVTSQERTVVRSLEPVRIRKDRPRQGTDAGVVRLAAAVILCSGA